MAEGGKVAARVVEGIIAKAAARIMPEVAEDAVKAASKDAAKDIAKDVAKDAGKDAAKDAGKDAAKDAGRQSARDTAEAGNDTAKQVADRTATKDPIDVASGEVLLHQVDVELPGVLPLVLDRTHVSSYRTGRWFGTSWASTLDQRLEVDGSGACFVGTEGIVLVYPIPMYGEPTMPARGPRWPLVAGPDGYTITNPQQGRTLHFAAQPNAGIDGGRAFVLPLKAITDRNGNRIELTYDGAGTLTEVRHSGGYRIGVETTDGRITALRLLNAEDRPVLRRFGYTEGRLTEVVNASGSTTRFEYDPAGRMTRWEDGNGHWYSYTYDERGRAVAGRGPDDFLNTRLAYADGSTVAADSNGHQTTYELDDQRQIVAVRDPSGNATRFERDAYGRLLSRTDPLSRVTRYAYDDHDNLVEVIRADGSRSTIEHDVMGLPVEIKEADGAVWRQAYDRRGNLVGVTDPLGSTTTYEYDQSGRLISVTDPLGQVTRITPNPAGLPVVIVDPLGNITSHERDAFGRITATRDPVGGVTRFGWTIDGLPAWRLSPVGGTERWVHDREGNISEFHDAAGRVTRFQHTYFGAPSVETQPGGASLSYAYDREMRLVAVTNNAGLVWRYAYDRAGNVVGESDFDGRVSRYAYDAAGQLIERVNGLGEVTTYVRDILGHVIEKRVGDTTETFAYDAVGRLTEAANADATIRLRRNALGQVVAEECNGRVLRSEYDRLGHRVRRRTPSGAETACQYDPAGRPVAMSIAGNVLSFAYDAAGREVQRRIGAGAILDQRWDPAHRLQTQTLWGAPIADPARTHPDGVSSQAQLLQHRSYSYGLDGSVTEIGDRLGGDRRFALDQSGRVTAVRSQTWGEQYAYDAAGNLLHAVGPTTRIREPAADDFFGERSYVGNRLSHAGRIRYEYDRAGRVILRQHRRLSGKPLSWRYTWDADDRLVGVLTPDGQVWRYRYDPLGRRIAKQRLAPDDGHVIEQTDFTWDEFLLGEQSVLREGATAWHTTTWDYEPGGCRPVAQTEHFAARTAPQEWIDQRFNAIVSDLVGSPAELVALGGELSSYLSSSLWGHRLSSGPERANCPLRFPGQYLDLETGLHYNYRRYYNPADGRYLSCDPAGLIAGPNAYSYVLNPLTRFDLLGLSDTCTITVYRRQTDHPMSKRLSVDSSGNVALRGKGTLYVNMSDDIKHTLDFRGGKGEIVAFDVPSSYRDEIRRTAVPQQNPGDFTPGEWKEMKRICPEISDPTRGNDLYGIPSSMLDGLRRAIIPGSGRIIG